MEWISIVGFIIIVVGGTMLVGFGWLTFLLDFISALDGTSHPSGTYDKNQENIPPAKKSLLKNFGIVLIIIGVLLTFYGFSS